VSGVKLTLKKTIFGFSAVTPEGQKYLDQLQLNDEVEVSVADGNPGSWPMLKTWRKWMDETAREMSRRGCTMPLYTDSKGVSHGTRPFKADDAHDLFTSTYLGTDEQGRRKTWSLTDKRDEVQASKGDRLWAMDMHVQWCLERGIKLTIPSNSEYRKLHQQQAA
jgi:hypothetical protein